MGHGGHQPQFHYPPSQQAQCPVVVALGGLATSQGYQVRFSPRIQLKLSLAMLNFSKVAVENVPLVK